MPAPGRTRRAHRRALARRLYPDSDAPPDWLETALLRPGQVALLFQVSRRTVADWARDGRLPTAVLTPGGHRRFRARDVRALIDSSSRRVEQMV